MPAFGSWEAWMWVSMVEEKDSVRIRTRRLQSGYGKSLAILNKEVDNDEAVLQISFENQGDLKGKTSSLSQQVIKLRRSWSCPPNFSVL